MRHALQKYRCVMHYKSTDASSITKLQNYKSTDASSITKAQMRHALQNYKSTGASCITKVQMRHALQKYRCVMHYESLDASCITKVQMRHALQKHICVKQLVLTLYARVCHRHRSVCFSIVNCRDHDVCYDARVQRHCCV